MKKIIIVLNQLLLNCKLFPAGNTSNQFVSFTLPPFSSSKRFGLRPPLLAESRLSCPSLNYNGRDIKIQLKLGGGAGFAGQQPFPACYDGLFTRSGRMINGDRVEAGTGSFITRDKKYYRSELYYIENIVQGNSNH